jgi:hypothetical protein
MGAQHTCLTQRESASEKLSEINNLIESTKLRFHQEKPTSQMPADVFISKYNF